MKCPGSEVSKPPPLRWFRGTTVNLPKTDWDTELEADDRYYYIAEACIFISEFLVARKVEMNFSNTELIIRDRAFTS